MWLVTYQDIAGRMNTRRFDTFEAADEYADRVGGYMHREMEDLNEAYDPY